MKLSRKTLSEQLALMCCLHEKPHDRAIFELFWAILQGHTDAAVVKAFAAHTADPDRGRFMPKPADIVAKLPRTSAAVGANEAWALAVQSYDESASLVLTEQILSAAAVVRPLWDIRDKVAARMAFIEAYERAVREQPETRPVVSLGTDQLQRLQLQHPPETDALLTGPVTDPGADRPSAEGARRMAELVNEIFEQQRQHAARMEARRQADAAEHRQREQVRRELLIRQAESLQAAKGVQ